MRRSAPTSGVASFTIAGLSVGTHSLTAVYSGDTNDLGSTSTVVSEVIGKAPTTTTLTSSLNPSTFGVSVTFTATLSPATATGTVSFMDGSNSLFNVSSAGGIATFTTASLTGAAHSITAVYSVGDANDLTSTSAVLTQTVSPANQSITFNSLSNQVFGTGPFTIAATATSGLPVSFSAGSLIDVQFGCIGGVHRVSRSTPARHRCRRWVLP